MTDNAIAAAFRRAGAERRDGWAVADTQHRVGFDDLCRMAEEASATFRSYGLRRGDAVALEVSNTIGYLATYLGVLVADAIVVPRDRTSHPAERAAEDARLGIDLDVTCLDVVSHGGSRHKAPELRVDVTSGCGRLRNGRAGCVWLPTSGVSGMPKRAMHDAERLVANAARHADSVGLDEHDVALVMLSPAFGYCHTAQILAHVLVGGRIVFAARPGRMSDALALGVRHRATNTTLVPALMTDRSVAEIGQAGLRQVTVGGSSARQETLARWLENLGSTELIQTWGMTEAGPRITTWRSSLHRHRLGSVGLPLEGIDVWSSNGDAAGELVVRTPDVMLGYAQGTAEQQAVLNDGALHTGDVGRVDDDGFVWIEGREKYIYSVGGLKVSAEEVEAELIVLDAIADAQAYAVRDSVVGERLRARVVLEPGESSAGDWRARLLERLPPHKVPSELEIVEELPRTATGKLRRHAGDSA